MVEHNVEEMWQERDALADAVRRQADAAVAGLDAALQATMAVLVQRKNSLSEQAKTLGLLLHEVETQLQAKARSNLIKHSAEFMRMFENIQRLKPADETSSHVTADFVK